MSKLRKAVFLDRDGTINEDKGYTHKIDDIRFTGGALQGMRELHQRGFLLFVVTNQAGIARGMYSEEDVNNLHLWMNDIFMNQGFRIEEFLICPHHPDFTGRCDCRKPGNLLLEYAIEKYNLDRQSSWMIGDRASDYEAAKKSGLNFIGVDGRYSQEFILTKTAVDNSLLAAALTIKTRGSSDWSDVGKPGRRT